MQDIFSYSLSAANEALEPLLMMPRVPKAARVYICSPLRGKTAEKTYENMLKARWYMLAAYFEGASPVAPHAYLPLLLNDHAKHEQDLALAIGQMLLSACDWLYVCGTKVSAGMRGEIHAALLKGMAIRVFHPDARDAVKAIADAEGLSVNLHLHTKEAFEIAPPLKKEETLCAANSNT